MSKEEELKKIKELGYLKEADFDIQYDKLLEHEKSKAKELDKKIVDLENELDSKGIEFRNFLTQGI